MGGCVWIATTRHSIARRAIHTFWSALPHKFLLNEVHRIQYVYTWILLWFGTKRCNVPNAFAQMAMSWIKLTAGDRQTTQAIARKMKNKCSIYHFCHYNKWRRDGCGFVQKLIVSSNEEAMNWYLNGHSERKSHHENCVKGDFEREITINRSFLST